MIRMTLGNRTFLLDSTAISCVRYRAAYGKSALTALAEAGTAKEREGLLLRVCREMMDPAHRPELPALGVLAYRNRETFLAQAEKAVADLLDNDGWTPEDRGGDGTFDEYDLLAAMAAAGLDARLLYELPVLHLAELVERLAALRDPERKTYRKMTDRELAEFYKLPI